MGAISSKPQKTDSEIKQMADNLFTFMYTQYDINEIWDIAEKPNEYILELSELIHHHLTVVGYTSSIGEKGEIYVRRIDDYKKDIVEVTELTKEQKAIEREERKRNAQTVAFFFIRIFQILGAMLLVIRDTPIIPEDSGYLLERRANPDLPRVQYPGVTRQDATDQQQKQEIYRLQQRLQAQSGGALSTNINLGSLECFRNFLSDATTEQKTQLKSPILFSFTDNLFLAFTSPLGSTNVLVEETLRAQPKFIFRTKSGIQIIPIEAIITSPPSISINDNPLLTQITLPTMSRSRLKTSLTIEYDMTATETKKKYRISDSSLKYIAERSLIQFPITSISRFLEAYMLYYLDAKDPSTHTEPLYARRTKEEDKVTSYAASRTGSLHNPKKLPGVIKQTYETLLNKIGHSHCKRRALQLLNAKSILQGVDNIDGRSAPYTNICAYSAPPEISSSDGKPVITQKESVALSDYRPTEALGQLFGKINRTRMDEAVSVLKAFVREKEGADPSLYGKSMSLLGVKDGWSNEESAMSATLQRLSSVFEVDPSGTNPTGFKDLKMKRSKKCDPNKWNKEDLQANIARELRTIAQELIDKHNASLVYISEFLEKVFNINPSTNQVSGISEDVMMLGLSGLDDLTDQARGLLVNYYMDCETIYQKGVRTWEASVPDQSPGNSVDARTNSSNSGGDSESESESDATKRYVIAELHKIASDIKAFLPTRGGTITDQPKLQSLSARLLAIENRARVERMNDSEITLELTRDGLTQQQIDFMRSGATAGNAR